ncbi:RICIN domain-containing protein [Pelagicoccus mobilis]|uniref:RICIN domain-containing protein n=1 Tax=Pelagicoccus mobilis TaxID=415221 RepID=A0A934RWJ7_9BACT|nr:RICIN domain-containing protein [Pelagicoccus mobilis]MBK1877811.1 RICIN domain-containing protein [Pelagicoccus mobilis]
MKRSFCIAIIPVTLLLGMEVTAQERHVLFDTSSSGTKQTIEKWGLELTWPSSDNARRTLEYMGKDAIDFARVGFHADAPLVDGQLTNATKSHLDEMAELAILVGEEKPWALMPATESGVDSWYKNGSQVVPERWIQGLKATMDYYDHEFGLLEPFNEPDYPWGQGTKQNYADIFQLLDSDSYFDGVSLVGPSTLNSDKASEWYAGIKDRADYGSTHSLDGTMETYISFIEGVVSDGRKAINPEAHNVAELLAGAEYGIEEAMWWAAAERTRANFVRANKGVSLGYSEHRDKWTAAAVYHAPDGDVLGFVGSAERQAKTTGYQFVALDRDVFFDGYGPTRFFMIDAPGGTGYQQNQPNAERVISIEWGEDVQPVISGRYQIVNRNSGLVMSVGGGSQGDGANIRQGTASGAMYQQWDVLPLDDRHGGDYSYFSMKAAHSGKSADVRDWSLVSGGNVNQWLDYGNENQEWFFEYEEDGYFYIRSRWSGKYLEVASASLESGGNIRQADFDGGSHQQWRLLPAEASVEFVAPSAPVGLEVVAGPASMALSWSANGEGDLASYNVYRSLLPEGPFDMIARNLTEPALVDGAANQVLTYYYRVKAVDESLNHSNPSEIVSGKPRLGASLVAAYEFEEGVVDASDNGNELELVGSLAFEEGKLGERALSFNGNGNYARLPATVANFEALTVAAWVRWGGGIAEQRVFDFSRNPESGFHLSTGPFGEGMDLVGKHGGENWRVQGPELAQSAWAHVAVTLDGQQARLFVDGVLAGTVATSVRPVEMAPVLNQLGRSSFDSGAARFVGSLDDVRIYNYALADVQVEALFEGRSLSPAEAWRLSYFGSGEATGDAADDADPDGDGILNLSERAFGGDPTKSDIWIQPRMDDSGALLSLIYRRSRTASDLLFSVLESSDLDGSWDLSEGESEILGTEEDVETVRFTRRVVSGESVFLKLRVESL